MSKRKPRTKAVGILQVCGECERCVSCGRKATEHMRCPTSGYTWGSPIYTSGTALTANSGTIDMTPKISCDQEPS